MVVDMNKEMRWFTFIGCYGLPMFIVSETPYTGSIWDHKNDNKWVKED